jgi:uncharacterized protein YacL
MAEPIPSVADAQRQARTAIVRIVRMTFAVLIFTVTILYILKLEPNTTGSGFTRIVVEGWLIPLSAGFLLATVVMALDILTPTKKLTTLTATFLGLLAGIVATFALSFVIDLIVQSWDIKQPDFVAAIKILLGISLCYLGISTVLQTQDDFRLVIPYVEFAKQIRGPKPLILDSSALIDARIADLGSTGVLQAPLVIPRFIVAELQALSDSGDRAKRTRGRRGLDVISKLQRNPALDVSINETQVPALAVDQMLVELARVLPGTIVTADAGLQRVASIHDVPVLNMHEVAAAMKPSLIPGTRLDLHIARAGEQPGQGVGFLDDGTMVVVDDGAPAIGTDLPIEITSAVQTSAGRLLFARPQSLGPAGDIDPHHINLPASAPGPEATNPAANTPHNTPGLPGTTVRPPDSPPNDQPPPSGPLGPGRFRRPGPPRNPRR